LIFKDKFPLIGWRSVGFFDFKASSFIFPLSLSLTFIFLFILFAWIFENLLKLPNYSWINNSKEIRDKKNKKIIFNEKIIFFISLLIITFNAFINYFMFTHKIGITGVAPQELPFKLVGIIYYYRLFIVPYIYFRISALLSKKTISRLIILLIFISANFTALVSGSKGLYVLHMLPLIIYLIKWKNYKTLICSLLFLFLSLPAYGLMRNIIYSIHYQFEEDFLNLDVLLYLIQYISETVFKDPGQIIQSAFLLIGRFLGIRELLMTVYNPIEIVNPSIIFHYFYGLRFLDVNNFVPLELTGITLPEGRGFGAGVDLISYCYLSTRNPIFFTILVAILSFSFILIEKLLIIILKNLQINIFATIVIVHLLFLRYSQRLDTFPIIILFGFILLSVRSLLLNSNNYNYLNQP
tara:strand:- start:16623 stop:17849 length:1227 start_codon:yes stop_codon:yes gene_type:complete